MSAKEFFTWSDTYANLTSFIGSFGKAIRDGDGAGAANACLDFTRTIIIDGMNIAESVAAASPIDAKVAGNAALIASSAIYADTMVDSYSKDPEKVFIKKQIGGFIGIFSSTAQFFFEENYDIYDIGSYIGLSDSRTMAENVGYLKGKDLDDWMRLFGLNKEDAEKAKAAADAIPEPEEEIIDPLSGEPVINPDKKIHPSSSNISPWWSSLLFSGFAKLAGTGSFNREGSYYNYDPIVLDLDGDGIEIIDVNNDRNIYFDHNNDGIKTKTSWVDSDDGFLVMDRNNDGIINNGTELFGNSTEMNDGTFSQNGFIALAELDSDKNGIINNLDSKYKDLKIWRDINSDGVSQSKELFSLEQLGIAEIDLSYVQKDTELIGDNIEAQTSHYVDSEGNHRTISDLNFSFNTFNRQFSDHLALTDEQSHQLNIGGSGTVRDLREAATLSSELNAIIEEFKQAKTKEEQFSVIPSLVLAWAKTSLVYSENIDLLPAFKKTGDDGTKIVGQKSPEDLTGSDEINYITSQLADKIAILDVFSGMGGSIYYTNKKDLEQIQLTIINQYTTLCESIYRSLIIDTRLAPYYDLLQFDSSYHIDFAPMIALFESNFAQDPMNTFIDLGELLSFETRSEKTSSLCALFEKYLKYAVDNSYFSIWTEKLGTTALTHLGFIAGTANAENINGSAFVDYIYSDTGQDKVYAAAGDDIIWGGSGNDSLYGNDGNDFLDGGDGDDYLNGDKGQDTLIGGAGNDTLEGGSDTDTYIFRTGHGRDTITDNFSLATNKLVFEGAQSNQLVMTKEGNNLVIQVYGTDDAVIVKDFCYGTGSGSFELVFDDRTISMDELNTSGVLVYGTDQNNSNLTGWYGDDSIYGFAGNDSLSGNDGNDLLDGGDGDDTLNGDKGQDTLIGGAGNDTLDGGSDTDTYIFRTGHGHDIVTDDSTSAINRLIFEGAQSSQLLMKRENNTLVIQVYGTDDTVTVSKYFYHAGYTRYELVFDDRTVSMDELHASGFLVYGTDQNNSLAGWSGDDSIYGFAGNDTLSGKEGNDLLNGGEGDDKMEGDKGNDTYIFQVGHGHDTVSENSTSDVNRLIFEGAQSSQLLMKRENNTLVIQAFGTDDTVTLSNYFYHADYTRYELAFDDRTVSMDELHASGFLVYGTDQNNSSLAGWSGDDSIYGFAGNDTLSGKEGNDLLDGGAGDDKMEGGKGNDTYIFQIGHGHDTVSENSTSEINRLIFEGAQSSQLLMKRENNTLVIQAFGTDDTVTLSNYFYHADYTRYELVFDDRTVSMDELHASGFLVYGTDKNNSLVGWSGDDSIYGFAGNDTLSGKEGNDLLDGGEGDDRLYGEKGNDTYIFQIGHGHDTLSENSTSEINRLIFEGAQSSQLLMKRENNTLVIQAFNTDDTVTLSDYFYSASYTRYELVFDDRTVSMDELHASGFLVYGTDKNNSLVGWSGDDSIYGFAGNDALSGKEGNDLLDGGEGDDRLYGEKGNDTYIFRAGHGKDILADKSTSDVNTLVFEGAQSSQLVMNREGDNLVIQAYGADDAVSIDDFFINADCTRFELRFDDRTISMDELNAYGFQLYGTDTANTLSGWNNNDTLYGYGGNDYLYGYDGDDTLDGGLGDDSLSGGNGSDVYKFYKGHGKDTVIEHDTNGVNTLVLEGAYVNYVSMEKKGNSLVINAYRDEDTITIDGYFYSQYSRRLEIQFEDKKVTMEDLPEFVAETLAKNDVLRSGQPAGVQERTLLSNSPIRSETVLSASSETAQLNQLIDAMAAFGDSEGGTGMTGNIHRNEYSHYQLTTPQ